MAYVASHLFCEVAFSFYHNDIALYVGLSAFAGAKDDVDGVPFGFRHIAFVEFLFVSDLDDLKAFLYEVGGELPQLFKVAVAVEDSRKVLFGVVGGDSEVVRHSVFSFAAYAAICLMVLLA